MSLHALRLLPGLDGTARLLAPFVEAARRAGFTDVAAIAYPADRVLGYAALEALARDALPREEPFMLLGESFSGPVALAIAADAPLNLRGLGPVNAIRVRCAVHARTRGQEERGSGCRSTTER